VGNPTPRILADPQPAVVRVDPVADGVGTPVSRVMVRDPAVAVARDMLPAAVRRQLVIEADVRGNPRHGVSPCRTNTEDQQHSHYEERYSSQCHVGSSMGRSAHIQGYPSM